MYIIISTWDLLNTSKIRATCMTKFMIQFYVHNYKDPHFRKKYLTPPPPSPSPCACCPSHPCSLSPAPTHVYTDTTVSQVEGAGGEQLAVRLIDSWSSSGRPQTGGGAGYRPGHYSHHTTTHSGSSPSGGSFFSPIFHVLYIRLYWNKNRVLSC